MAHSGSRMGVRVGADATMTDSACVHPAVALVDEPGLGRTMRAVGSVERGALLLHEAPIVLSSAIDELPEPLQATYRAVSAPPLLNTTPRRLYHAHPAAKTKAWCGKDFPKTRHFTERIPGADHVDQTWRAPSKRGFANHVQAAATGMCGLPPLMDVHCYLEAPTATRVTLLASCCTFHVGAEPPAGWPSNAAAPGIVECARRVAHWAVANVPAAAGMAEDELVQAQGVFALNSHNLGELPGTAVYATGSKLSHCCVRAQDSPLPPCAPLQNPIL